MKTLSLQSLKKENVGDKVRLVAEFFSDGVLWKDPLWFEFDKQYEDALVTEVCDGFLVSMLAILSRWGVDFESAVPATRDVVCNMEALLDLLVQENPNDYKAIAINVPVVEGFDLPQKPRGIAASGSCGVDSLHTLFSVNRSKFFLKPTHLIFNNTGSNEAGPDPKALLAGRIQHTKKFCEENGYEFIYVNSNYSQVFNEHYGITNLYVNMSVGYLLAKGIGTYYLSSGFDVTEISFKGDPAHAEPILIHYLSSCYLKITHVAGDFRNRYGKVRDLITDQASCDSLNVCLFNAKNCGFCGKCRRMLGTLECLDAVEVFKKSFDLKKYYATRDDVFKEIILDHWGISNFEPEIMAEIWPDFKKKLTFKNWMMAGRKWLFLQYLKYGGNFYHFVLRLFGREKKVK